MFDLLQKRYVIVKLMFYLIITLVERSLLQNFVNIWKNIWLPKRSQLNWRTHKYNQWFAP